VRAAPEAALIWSRRQDPAGKITAQDEFNFGHLFGVFSGYI
jgi:hypothetical protein